MTELIKLGTLLMFFCCSNCSIAQDTINQLFADKLIELKSTDQQIRRAFGKAIQSNLVSDSLRNLMEETDKKHSKELHSLIDIYGFPQRNRGRNGSHAFLLGFGYAPRSRHGFSTENINLDARGS